MKYLLLFLTLVAAAFAQANNCVPASMKYMADRLFYKTTETQWAVACKTDADGTGVENIAPAWKMITKNSRLVPVYMIGIEDGAPIPAELQGYVKDAKAKREIEYYTHLYLWIGLHPDEHGKIDNAGGHCAVVVFLPAYVHMISPNSVGPDGYLIEENLTYKEFFSETILVLEAIRN